ncbi:MAG: TIGR03905 family TSCPD domain-containing protein [Eubacteriales bacterium]|nr:TIGR03905 family TSCPD domain-containing protein [Clostridiales bacterium]MDY5709850.1 TIGR03905 family TSCPD domain-containing protein [Eubacteriales bacterium]
MHYTLYPKGVCSTQIDLDVNDGKIHNLSYTGGCNGNLKALGAMCEGASAEEVIRRLSGITCGYKATSCSDQLARLLKDAMKKKA